MYRIEVTRYPGQGFICKEENYHYVIRRVSYMLHRELKITGCKERDILSIVRAGGQGRIYVSGDLGRFLSICIKRL